MLSKPNKLDQLKQKLQNKDEEGNLVTSLYYLIKELKCLPEVIGREFEVEYNEKGQISRIIQKPMSISTLTVLFHELEEDMKRQEKDMKKNKPKGRR